MILDAKRLHNLAAKLAYNNAQHECPEQLVQDLEQAAWVKFLTLESYAHLWSDLYYAMLEELSRWLWQCKRGRGKTRLLTAKVELYEWTRRALHGVSPEKIILAKEAIGREMWLARNREYSRKYMAKRRETMVRTQEQRDYHRAYMRWVRGGRKPEHDPRFKKGHYKEARRISLSTHKHARKPLSLVSKYGVQVVRKALS